MFLVSIFTTKADGGIVLIPDVLCVGSIQLEGYWMGATTSRPGEDGAILGVSLFIN